jgi:hypothetical protein
MQLACVGAAKGFRTPPTPRIDNSDELQRIALHNQEDNEKEDLRKRNEELDKCIASKRDQIAFCNSYVDRTRQAARTIASKCDFHYDDRRYLASDGVRFDWCMDLNASTPAGDPNYPTRGEDPVKFLDNVLSGCRGMQRLRTPFGVLRTNKGPQK